MSNRFYDYDKGSSRSARDDSRRHADDRRERGRRSKSRSPHRQYSPERTDRHRDRSPRDRRHAEDDDVRRSRSPKRWDKKDVPAPPPPPRITKISIDLPKPKALGAPIKMSLGGPSKPSAMPKPKPSVASVFAAEDDDDEPEEMPAEARMRMRNIGRETPTSAGPNSFGKTKHGFCDSKKVFEKNLKQALEDDQQKKTTKFPQTIYKIKGP